MNLEDERKKLLQATIDALNATWPMSEGERSSLSIAATDRIRRRENQGAAPNEPQAPGGEQCPACARAARNHSSRRA